MSAFGNGKHCRFCTVWIMVILSLAVGCKHAKGIAKSRAPQPFAAQVMEETTEAALAIKTACDEILSGDFESAQEIVWRSAVPDSKSLRQLRRVIDEYMAIKARRQASENDTYQAQIEKLKKLHRKDLREDINDISEVFEVVLKASEYADKEQKQALLKDAAVLQTIQTAKTKATESELKGKWLDAYTICYSKLKQIYKDNEAYSDYGQHLLEKADILRFLEDSPCETVEQRCAGINKQTFINAIDILDSSYVNVINYHRMAVEGIDRCELLAEVMSNSDLDKNYKMSNEQFIAWSEALAAVANEVNQTPLDVSKDKLLNVFEEVLALDKSCCGQTTLLQPLLIAQFAKGSLSWLDPYTAIYWPNQVQNLHRAVSNQFSGIGIKFSKEKSLTKVASVLPDTPAYYFGLLPGDVIKAVDGVETENMSSDCIVNRITGAESTKVTLTIRHSDEDKLRDIAINRAKIIVPSIHGWQRDERGKQKYMIDEHDKIGYVRISSFNSGTTGDFEKVCDRLEKNGLNGLILDLRSNPGGLLSSAVEIADKFIKEGLIVRTQPRCGMPTYLSAHEDGTLANYPLVVLVNQFTASASEVLAGVLQDQKYNRATLVGETSYGKGSVQSITSYCGNGAQLKYTVAYYHLPSGQRVRGRETIEKTSRKDWGISPNVNVALRSNELQNIADVQKANELLIKADHNNAFSKINRYLNQETIDADPQLAIGLLVLKSKMIQAGHELAGAAQ